MRRLHFLLLAGLSVASPEPGVAQAERAGRSVDVGVGVGLWRGGGLRRHRDGPAAAVLLTKRLSPRFAGVSLLGVVVSAQSPFGTTDECLLAPGGSCAPDFPAIQSLAVLAGWELPGGANAAAARAMVGPAVFHSNEGAVAPGAQARIDLAAPPLLHAAFVAWAQGCLIPRLRGETYRTAVLGIGIRIR